MDDWVEKSYAASTTGINGKPYVVKVLNPKKIIKAMFQSYTELILGAILSSKAGASFGAS